MPTNDPVPFAADLLAGRRNRIDDQPSRNADDLRKPDEVFADVGGALDELERLRARDPRGALEVFRSLVGNESLDDRDLDSFIDVWRTAISDPSRFTERLEQDARGLGWWDALRGFLHRPEQPSADERTILDGMAARYRLPRHPLAPPVNPHERIFEDPDPVWPSMLGVKLAERHWPDGLVPMRRHTSLGDYVYPATEKDGVTRLTGEVPHTVALFSDFGTGYYHSWGIAEQLAAWGFPYSFHLGDVYYAGRPVEFAQRFHVPLSDVVECTRLFGLAENHELYGGGKPYLDFFDWIRGKQLTPQEASYFCVQFPHHQVIAIDANWQGRRRFPPKDAAMHAWLRARLDEANGRTNILLTGNAPFDHGDSEPRQLFHDLEPYLGEIALWFWGDDHYCALYESHAPEIPFYGSCIGHGGFPGARQERPLRTCTTKPLWLEDQARFPSWTGLRPHVTNNGWCQMTLRPGGGVDLLYVDWLWCKRASVSFDRHGKALQARDLVEYDREDNPVLHVPPATLNSPS